MRERHPQAAQLGDVAGPRCLQEQLQPSGVAVRAGRQQVQRLVVAVVRLVRGAGPAGVPGRAQGVLEGRLVVARGGEVVGDGRGERVVLAVQCHQRLGQPAVRPAAVRPDQLVGERLPGQRVPEAVLRTPAVAVLDEQLQVEPGPYGVVDLVGGRARGEREHRGVEPVAGERRGLEHGQGRRGE